MDAIARGRTVFTTTATLATTMGPRLWMESALVVTRPLEPAVMDAIARGRTVFTTTATLATTMGPRLWMGSALVVTRPSELEVQAASVPQKRASTTTSRPVSATALPRPTALVHVQLSTGRGKNLSGKMKRTGLGSTRPNQIASAVLCPIAIYLLGSGFLSSRLYIGCQEG